MLAIVVFILFIGLLLLSVPISSTLSIVSLAPSLFDPNFTISPEYIIRAMFGGIDSFPLLAVPMFVLSGILMAKGGVSKKLFDVFSFFIGKRTAGMPCAVIITCFILWCNFRKCPCNGCSGRKYDHSFTCKIRL